MPSLPAWAQKKTRAIRPRLRVLLISQSPWRPFLSEHTDDTRIRYYKGGMSGSKFRRLIRSAAQFAFAHCYLLFAEGYRYPVKRR